MKSRRRIEVSGIVQGVGFRPFVFRLANQLNLTGKVLNNSNGLQIEIQGDQIKIDQFLDALYNQSPPLSQITKITQLNLKPVVEKNFEIIKSKQLNVKNTLISPDITTCKECLQELLNPLDRRYHYPFINCTNCGPRYTIIKDIPYDRPKTSMAGFKQCLHCRSEYDDPHNRRFHAQPNACPVCGPHLEMCDTFGKFVAGNPVEKAVQKLLQGKILAIKGLGGFHLACDANNHAAVKNLRKRKHRFEKPLALMVRNVDAAGIIAFITNEEKKQLQSLNRPIVLCLKKENTGISSLISIDNDYFGIMLPYTPLHEVLFSVGDFSALVMTSANISEEPICFQNDECLSRMKNIADYYLLHNRDIYTRCDDSVLRVYNKKSFFIRRSRGYTPRPVLFMEKGTEVLAVGGHLKNTVCLTRDNFAFLSQHIGDLENLQTLAAFEQSIEHLQRLFEIAPKKIIHDLHPEYLSTKWVQENATVPFIGIQHHYAHILSVMAEYGLRDDVIGFSLDGTGFGADGNIWGGEILICNINSFQRYAHFKNILMPGGEKAIHQPWRMAVSYLFDSFSNGLEIAGQHFPHRKAEIKIIGQMLERRINSPLTSSCGRLFDAVAAILGLREEVDYEGQAAIKLENLAEKETIISPSEIEPFELIRENENLIIDSSDLIRSIVIQKKNNIPISTLSKAFHHALIRIFTEIAKQIRNENKINRVALSGGCFQNLLLLSGLENELIHCGFEVYTNNQVPVNDGGLCLGQAYWGMFNELSTEINVAQKIL